MDKKQLQEVSDLLAKAWVMVYVASKGEFTGDLHDLRMKINSVQVDVINIQEKELAK